MQGDNSTIEDQLKTKAHCCVVDVHDRGTRRSLRSSLQATKLLIVTSAIPREVGVVTTSPRFSVRFMILYRVIQPLIQHCLLRKIGYLNIIYVIATRNYEFFTTGIVP